MNVLRGQRRPGGGGTRLGYGNPIGNSMSKPGVIGNGLEISGENDGRLKATDASNMSTVGEDYPINKEILERSGVVVIIAEEKGR